MMYPAAIHQWFVQYDIDPLVGWEALEVAAPRWSEGGEMPMVEDGAELMSSMLDYIVGMIDIAADASDEPLATHSLITTVVPMALSLQPFLEWHNKQRILEAADKVKGLWVHGMFRTVLFPSDPA